MIPGTVTGRSGVLLQGTVAVLTGGGKGCGQANGREWVVDTTHVAIDCVIPGDHLGNLSLAITPTRPGLTRVSIHDPREDA
jgi:hypothetical protein